MVGSRSDEVVALERRRQVAAERRRLLTFALHSERTLPANESFDTAVTDRYERIAIEDLDDAVPPAVAAAASADELRARVEQAAALRALQPPAPPTSLGERVEHLRAQAAACRAQAIALNSKLVLLEAEHARLRRDTGEVHAVREQLVQGSARLDHAIEEIGAVTSVEQQLADSLLR